MFWTYRTIHALLSADQKRRFWLIVALMMVMSILDLSGVAMIIPFLSVLANPEVVSEQPALRSAYDLLGFSSTYAFLQFLGVMTFILVMSGIAVRALSFYLANLFARQVNMSFGMARLRQYLSRPYEWFLQQHSADLSKSVLQEINEIVNGSVSPALRIIANSFLILLLCGLLLVIEPLGAVVIALLFGLSFWFIDRAVRQRIQEMGHDRRRANRERHQVAGEALSGFKEVKMMALEQTYLERFFNPSLRLASYQARLQLVGEMPRFALEAMTFGGMIVFTLFLLWTNDGSLDRIVPVLGAFAFAALRLMPTAQVLFRDISVMRFGQAALEGLQSDLVSPGQFEESLSDTGPDVPLTRSLALEGVSFNYPATDRAALNDVSLKIDAGTTVGFMGPTGAGKSTVIDLILGLIRPSAGEVTVDGIPVTDDNRRGWQRQVGFVPQSIHLVDNTVAANIAHGLPAAEIDMDRVRSAARLAQIDDFICTLPEGYDTFVGDAGVRLSGGQRQRVGIARALYRDQSVLVFDEATSALDPVTERDVMESIRALSGMKTLVLVSHRLSTLTNCDMIFSLKDGRIAECGSYDSLRENSVEFRSMLTAAE